MSKRRRMDLVLIVGIMLVALISAITVYLTHAQGNVVVVKVDGRVVKELSLSENADITIEGYQGGVNLVKIEDGKAYVTEADCPDELCVKTGGISRAGETIVCLPHRVVVEIKGNKIIQNESDDFDSIVR